MPLDVQAALATHLAGRRGAAISLDPHEKVREDNFDAWKAVLAGTDAFFPSEDDLQLEGVADDPRPALRRLAGGRLRFVAFKRGRAGGSSTSGRRCRG
jgi:sugar/nucleoside kinase (ribokinase family)